MKPNQDIRNMIKNSPFKSYEVAKALGYSSGSSLSTRLQSKLPDDERHRIIRKIKSMSSDGNVEWRIKRLEEPQDFPEFEISEITTILDKVNQLRSDVDTATEKSDFQHIARLATEIAKLIGPDRS